MRRMLRGLPTVALTLTLAACASAPPRPVATPPAPAPAAPTTLSPRSATCATCGRIERMDAAAPSSSARPQGAVLGGVVGGVVSGPATATAGAAKAGSRNVRLVVLLDSGRRLILTQPAVAGMKVGSRVRVDRSRAVLLR